MAELAELEARIRVLEDIEAIKRVKAKYWWCNDKKLWDEVLDCFTEDVKVQYGTATKLSGAKAAAEFLGGSGVGRPSTVSIHQGHNAEIDVSPDGTAKARWEVYVYIIDEQDKSKRLYGGYYEDDFVKQGGKWKIKRLLFTPFLIESSIWSSQI